MKTHVTVMIGYKQNVMNNMLKASSFWQHIFKLKLSYKTIYSTTLPTLLSNSDVARSATVDGALTFLFVDLDFDHRSVRAKVVGHYSVPIAMHGHDPSKSISFETIYMTSSP